LWVFSCATVTHFFFDLQPRLSGLWQVGFPVSSFFLSRLGHLAIEMGILRSQKERFVDVPLLSNIPSTLVFSLSRLLFFPFLIPSPYLLSPRSESLWRAGTPHSPEASYPRPKVALPASRFHSRFSVPEILGHHFPFHHIWWRHSPPS